MKLWKCYNPKCAPNGVPGFDFAADAGVCPKCGVDIKHPRFGRFIAARVVIHFDPPSGVVEGVGMGRPACLPNEPPGGKYRMTGHHLAVTCPACQQAPEYLTAATEASIHPDYDVPVDIDVKAGTVKLDRPEAKAPVQAATQSGGCRG